MILINTLGAENWHSEPEGCRQEISSLNGALVLRNDLLLVAQRSEFKRRGVSVVMFFAAWHLPTTASFLKQCLFFDPRAKYFNTDSARCGQTITSAKIAGTRPQERDWVWIHFAKEPDGVSW